MYKVFLVEDEIIIREGLRSSIHWEQYGFTLAGDATDGEMALPEIRRIRPDVLITDIKMPFMDGLALSRLVRKELPETKIVIISGYDDFEYAQQAIQIGVEQYLLKPITKARLIQLLDELREKMEQESRQRDYIDQFRQEAQEYEQFSRRRFFEKLVEGHLSVQEAYEQAEKLDLDLSARCYNIILYAIHQTGGSDYNEPAAQLQEELVQFFLHWNDCQLFRWNLTTCAVLLEGTPEQIEAHTRHYIDNISRLCADANVNWYAAAGQPVSRLSSLPECFAGVSRILSCRYLCTDQHILTAKSLDAISPQQTSSLQSVDMSKISSDVILKFLSSGTEDELEEFVRELAYSQGEDALNSMLFGQYMMLNVRFHTTSFVQSLGYRPEDLLSAMTQFPDLNQLCGAEQVISYICALLRRGLELRQKAASSRYRDVLAQAIAFIDSHYQEDTISLNVVARAVNISPSYFSAVFSQEQGQTFTEYLTHKRIEQAKQLLRRTDKRSSEVAFAVGYRDPHYFSYLFKKTEGCTPRDYRAGGSSKK